MFTKISTMALLEASKADKKIMDDIVADEVKSDYNYTLKGLDTIGSMNMSIEAVPIMRDECGECAGKGHCGGKECGDECGGKECGNECGECNEAYMIDYDILYKFTEQNNYEDEVYAHAALCEYYNFDQEQLVVVAECDEVNKGLLKNALASGQLGVARRYCHGICNMLNHGIRVVKRSS